MAQSKISLNNGPSFGVWHFVMMVILLKHISLVNGKRVVFLPEPQTSHVRSHVHVAQEMAAQGHEVWVGIAKSMIRKIHVDTSNINVLPYSRKVKDLGDAIMVECGVLDNFWAGKDFDMTTISKIGNTMSQNSLEIIRDQNFMTKLEMIKPDLIVLDSTPPCLSLMAIPYKLNVPFAFFGTYHNPTNTRVPFTSACNPLSMSDMKDKLTFLQRVQNSVLLFVLLAYNPLCDDSIISKLVPERPAISVGDLSMKAEIFIVETDHILDYSRPMLPNTKLIGGTAARPGKALQGVYKDFSENFSNGTIVVSFGSSVLDIPQFVADKMLGAFNRIDYGVVWKINNDTLMHSKKVVTSSWIPQNDLLADSSTKVFISHCGANGLYEALYHGVPVLCLPMFADQMHNAMRVESKGFGLRADIRYVTEEELTRLILELTTNPIYKKNISKASNIFRQLYSEPLKEAAFWLNHVMEFGGSYMRFAGQEMPLYQFLLLDVLAFLLIVSVIFTFVFYFLCYKVGCTLVKCYRKNIVLAAPVSAITEIKCLICEDKGGESIK